MIDGRKPEEPPPADEGIGLPTPPSPGRLPPLDLPPPDAEAPAPEADDIEVPDPGR